MDSRLLAILVPLMLAGCGTPREIASEPPARVVKSDHVLVISSLGRLREIPQSLGDRVATTGRDINQFNAILETSFSRSIVSAFGAANTRSHVMHAASNSLGNMQPELARKQLNALLGAIYCTDFRTRQQCMRDGPKNAPNIALLVDPSEVKMNIPGSFNGVFSVSVFEVSTGQRLWQGRLPISRMASGKSHEEVAQNLAATIVERLMGIGFI